MEDLTESQSGHEEKHKDEKKKDKKPKTEEEKKVNIIRRSRQII